MRISYWSSDVCSSDLRRMTQRIHIAFHLDSPFSAVLPAIIVAGLLQPEPALDVPHVGAQKKGGSNGPARMPDQAMSVTRMPSVVFATLIFLHRVHAVVRVCGHHRAHRRGSGTVSICDGDSRYRHRSAEPPSALQSLIRISYAGFCLE